MSNFDSFDVLDAGPEERALPVSFGGRTFPWLPTPGAADIAARAGYELGDILDVLFRLYEGGDEEKSPAEALNEMTDGQLAVSTLLWLGFLTFEPGLELSAVQRNLTMADVRDLPVADMMDEIFPDDPEAGEDEDETVGKSTGDA
jgi:hypothetical protein